MFWTHNDSGGDPELVAVDVGGGALTSVRLAGARIVDWEALERTDCVEGSCLWVADTGDNEERRSDATLYRLVEPAPTEAAVVDAEAFPVRFPDGPRDVEALFVLPGQIPHLVTKGRNHPVTVYRYPAPLRPGEEVALEEVQLLGDAPPHLPRHVTGAAASPEGRMVVVRTYETLRFYRVRGPSDRGTESPPNAPRRPEDTAIPAEPLLTPLPGSEVNLRPLREAQGEAVAWTPDGRIALASEAGPGGRRGGLRILRCEESGER